MPNQAETSGLLVEATFITLPVSYPLAKEMMSSSTQTLLEKGGEAGEEELMLNGSSFVEKCQRVVAEWDKVFRIAWPMMFSQLFGIAMGSSNQMFAGHLSSLELSAVFLASSVINNFASGILSGLVSAQETLCGQAFGAGQVELLSIYLQRSWIILIAAAFLLSPLYIFAAPILKLLGQHEVIAQLVGRYAVRTIPQLFAVAVSFPMQKFLQSQRKVAILAWIGSIALVMHVALSGLFVYVFGWGFDGLAAAFNVSAWIVTLLQLIYIMGWCKDTWLGLSWSAFREIWSYLRLSLASAMSLCIGIWLSIALILYLGHLDNAVMVVGAFSICMNVTQWLIMVISGMKVAASVRVSNEIGSGRAGRAKYAILVISFTSLSIGSICAAAVLAFPNQLGALFTNDKEIQKTVADNAYILAALLIGSGLLSPLVGAAVGAGLQVISAYIVFASIIGGITAGFLSGYIIKGGLMGVLIVLSSGTLFEVVGMSLLLWTRDWKKEASNALSRVQCYAGLDTST